MNVKDLMIGNLLQDTTSIRIVNEISENGINCGHFALRSKPGEVVNIEPIEINEDWLSYFGFEKSIENGIDIFKKKMNTYESYFCVYYFKYSATGENHEGWRSYIESSKDRREDHWPYHNSVHELQNIYFVLTGDTLKQS